MLIQFVLSILLLAAVVMTWRRARQRAIRVGEAIVWSVLWILALVFVWDPSSSTRIARFVGVGRGVDLILYISITLLLILVFQLHVAHLRLERTLTELVRRQALSDFEKDRAEAVQNSPDKE